MLLVLMALVAVTPAALAADDYPYRGQTGTDPWGFYKGYCTSFVAYRMNRNAGPMSFYNYMGGDGRRWGNASNWGTRALQLGYPVDQTPAVGAIAWWGPSTISGSGHVAYVEAVNADGTIVIEDYNYVRFRYDRRTISPADSKRPSGYIHFSDRSVTDGGVPVITLSCVKAGGVYASAITPGFSATDNALKSVTATMDGAPFTSGASVGASGKHELVVTATDTAGNKATARAGFSIDPSAADPDVAFTAVAGADRYETAVRMSRIAFGSADSVIIATGENWPDALGGAALSGAQGAPILLTRRDSLPPSVLAEVRRLGATSAVILGGEGAVGPAVEAALTAELGDSAVVRIGGDDRYGTAELIAREAVAAAGDAYDGTCLVATGADFPDALAASPLGAAKRWPLVLVDPATPSGVPTTLDVIGARSAVILGGAAAVSPGVASGLEDLLGSGAVTRLSGADRYATAAAIAVYAAGQGLRWDGAAIATGQNFPDALAGGAAQGHLGSAMLLTRTGALVPEARNVLTTNRTDIRAVRFLGGEGAICTAVKLAVSQTLE